MRRILRIILILYITSVSCQYEAVIGPWKDGIIPYYLVGYFSNEELEALDTAMQAWERICGVKFQLVLPRSGAYEIRKDTADTDWNSSIGENNVLCFMNFGESSDTSGHLKHELGHCLGLVHEHQRPDRDMYVRIIWDNILPEYEYNFKIYNNPLIVEEDYQYDFQSIMHYYSSGFSIDGGPTIIPIDRAIEIERNEEITDIDVLKVVSIYGPPLE